MSRIRWVAYNDDPPRALGSYHAKVRRYCGNHQYVDGLTLGWPWVDCTMVVFVELPLMAL